MHAVLTKSAWLFTE